MFWRLVFFICFIFVNFYTKDTSASLNFCNRNAYIYPYTYNSGIKISNKNSVKGYKKQDIVKAEQAEALFINNNQTFQSNSIFVPKETFDLVSSFYIPDNQILEFSSNAVIDGNGQDLILGKYSQLLIDGGVTVTFKNMTIKNTLNTTSCPPIRCMDWYSKVCFDNVKFEFSDDWIFRNGQFFVHNDVEFTGTSKFSYRSVCSSFVASHANLIFDPRTTFEYYPSTANNKLIQMQDKTSTIIFDGSTLQTTDTGIRLTKGSIYFDNSITLSSKDNKFFETLMDLGVGSSVYCPGVVYAASWSPDGKYLAVGLNNSLNNLIVYRWNEQSFTITTSKYFGTYVYSTNWSPDGKYLAVGGVNNLNDVIIYEWNEFNLIQKDTKDFGSIAYSVNWSPDGRYLAIGGNNVSNAVIVYGWDGSSLTLTASKYFGTYASSVNWSPDGRYLAVGGSNNYNDVIIYGWNGSSLTVTSSKDFGTVSYSVNWSPDGKYLAAGGINGFNDVVVYSWNGLSLNVTSSKSFGNRAYTVNWSPDGRYLAVGGISSASDLIIYEWNGSLLIEKNIKDFGTYAWSVNWNPDGEYLSVCGNNNNPKMVVYGVNYVFDKSFQGYSNGIIFGNSQLGTSYDLDLYFLGGANLNINGKAWDDNVN